MGRSRLKKISIRKDDSIFLLPLEIINFFEADGKQTKVHLKTGNFETYKKNLNALEQILPADYYRVHKSYILSFDNIQEIKIRNGNAYHAITYDQKEIPIGRKAFRDIQNKFHSINL